MPQVQILSSRFFNWGLSMAYSDFTSLAKVKQDLGLVIHDVPRLFPEQPDSK
ncbi:MAG: hypothetical protein ACP5RH_11975 [Leptodesmis sp.]|uniref:hypothetical protein n=1 Tax=Leptodesmis sp. TaxID=3100501 RepID=UPI003D137716